MQQFDPTYQRNEKLAWTPMGEDLVILNLGQKRYVHQLNPVAAHVWSLLERPQELSTLARSVAETFDVAESQAREDIQELVEDFRRHALLN